MNCGTPQNTSRSVVVYPGSEEVSTYSSQCLAPSLYIASLHTASVRLYTTFMFYNIHTHTHTHTHTHKIMMTDLKVTVVLGVERQGGGVRVEVGETGGATSLSTDMLGF